MPSKFGKHYEELKEKYKELTKQYVEALKKPDIKPIEKLGEERRSVSREMQSIRRRIKLDKSA